MNPQVAGSIIMSILLVAFGVAFAIASLIELNEATRWRLPLGVVLALVGFVALRGAILQNRDGNFPHRTRRQ